jgi:ferredoxin
MAHHTVKSGYQQLVERLNRFPQGATPSRLLFEILRMLFSEREAGLVALLPIKPFLVEKAARAWKIKPARAQKILDELCRRAILVDIQQGEDTLYCLPPPMAGFFEFSLMRVRTDIDQKVLSELYYQYLNVEEEFIKDLFSRGPTQLGRVFVQEPMLTPEISLQVLDFERASHIIRTATHIGVGTCYCRHKMQHVDRDCKAAKQICMTFNVTAAALIRNGFARAAVAAEGLALLHLAWEQNLVQFGENVRQGVNFICNCCGCCCEALMAARKFGLLHPVQTTHFLPAIQTGHCDGCGRCVTVCPVAAMSLVSANDGRRPKRKLAKLDERICLGCGVCVRVCRQKAIVLRRRPEDIITPLNSSHRVILMAIERGTLQELIFDNQVLDSHRALAALLGVILRLPPVKRLMASQQLKSRYLEAIAAHYG